MSGCETSLFFILFFIFFFSSPLICDASHRKEEFVAAGFLRYWWKHSENNKEKNFPSFFSCKIWMPWSILVYNEVCPGGRGSSTKAYQRRAAEMGHFTRGWGVIWSWGKTLDISNKKPKIDSPAKSTLLMCCILFDMIKQNDLFVTFIDFKITL